MSRRPHFAPASGKRHYSPSDCAEHCRLPGHAYKVNALIASGASVGELQGKLPLICSNPYVNTTAWGQTPLHAAAAYGRHDVIAFLWEHLQTSDLNVREEESGSTPLHVAVLAGHLHCALLLLKLGADLFVKDRNGCSPLLVASLDRFQQRHLTVKEFYATYQDCSPKVLPLSWGTNANLLLGHADDKSRALPEFLPRLSSHRLMVNQGHPGKDRSLVRAKAALSKFHMILLTSFGEVFTCGHGRGGRLGHNSEESQLTPRFVDAMRKSAVRLIAAGQNHSVFVDTDNCLFTCGSNESGQLGPSASQSGKQQVDMAVSPRRVLLRVEKSIVGVAASRYHTAVVTSSKLYVFGTDRGQLGRSKLHNPLVSTPFCVPLSYQNGTDFVILEVAASNDVTACLCSAESWHMEHMYTSHFVFVCMNHTIHLATSLSVGLCQLNLWTRPSTQVSYSKSAKKAEVQSAAKETVVMCLSVQKELWSWTSGDSSFRKCYFANGPPAGDVVQLVVTCKLAVVTSLGEIYTGSPARRKPSVLPSLKKMGTTHDSSPSLAELCCRKAENIATSHFKPLLVQRVPVVDQAWLLAMDPRGDNFVAFASLPRLEVPRLPTEVRSDVLRGVHAALTRGPFHDIEFQTQDKHSVFSSRYFLASHSTSFLSRATLMTAGHYVVKSTCKFPAEVVLALLSALALGWVSTRESQPLTMESQASSELPGSCRITDGISRCYHALFGGSMPRAGQRSWSRSKCADMHDVTLATLDGVHLSAHKCVLVLRSPYYFGSMLQAGWEESDARPAPIHLHANGQVAEVLLDFLYEDDLHVVDSWDWEMLFSVLIAADALLISRLKSLCEFHLVSRIDHRNVADLLDGSMFFHAEHLFKACCDFIYFFLPMVLEARVLENLPLEGTEEVFRQYRGKLPVSRAMPVVGPGTVSSVLRGPSSRSERTLSESGVYHVGLEDVEIVEEEEVAYIVKSKLARRRQASMSKEKQRKNSSDMDLDELIAEMDLDDDEEEEREEEEGEAYGCVNGDNDGGVDADNVRGRWSMRDEQESVTPEPAPSPTLPLQSTPVRKHHGRKNFRPLSVADSPASPVTWAPEPSPSESSKSSMSLAEIMHEQAEQKTPNRTLSQQASPKPKAATSTPPIDVGWRVGSKQTQSQRKKQEKMNAKSPPAASASSTPGPAQQGAPRNPWAKTNGSTPHTTPSPQPSFLDIQQAEAATTAPTTPLSASSTGSRKSCTSASGGKGRPRKLSWSELESGQLSKPTSDSLPIPQRRAWGVPAVASTPPMDLSMSPASLESIMKSEKAALLPQPVSASKKLSIIQLEDKAIDELTEYYRKRFPYATCTVTRVSSSTPSAPPKWERGFA